MNKPWQDYEIVAHKVLNDLREQFGLSLVEGKQHVPGKESGTTWEIDAKAVLMDGEHFLVVEAKRHTTRNLGQDLLASVAYRIQDVEAHGAIIVSPLNLQQGAELVAKANKIEHVTVTADSTTERYMAEWMGQTFYGLTVAEVLNARDSSSATIGWSTK